MALNIKQSRNLIQDRDRIVFSILVKFPQLFMEKINAGIFGKSQSQTTYTEHKVYRNYKLYRTCRRPPYVIKNSRMKYKRNTLLFHSLDR